MSALSNTYLTPQQYLAFERASEQRHEYDAGKVYAMAGASRAHNLIVLNIAAALHTQLRNRNCTVYPSDMRVKVSPTGRYVYPDLTVVCGKEQFEDAEQDTLLNPTLIIEVLSDSTAKHDRGRKFKDYRTLDSFVEYLLIAQTEQRVEHFVRQEDGLWGWSDADALDQTVVLASIDCALRLADIYEKTVFDTDPGQAEETR